MGQAMTKSRWAFALVAIAVATAWPTACTHSHGGRVTISIDTKMPLPARVLPAVATQPSRAVDGVRGPSGGIDAFVDSEIVLRRGARRNLATVLKKVHATAVTGPTIPSLARVPHRRIPPLPTSDLLQVEPRQVDTTDLERDM
jgi:hypothetical protein